jgi:hypothetical protein
MKRAAWIGVAIACLLIAAGSRADAAAYRVLLVDATTTLEATLRVGALAGAIRQSGLAEVSAVFSDAESPYDDPLVGKSLPTLPYDLVIIIPRGIGEGTSSVVWLLVSGNPAADPAVSTALAVLGGGMSLVFGEGVHAAGPLDDLWATFTASLYVAEGWLR